MSNYINIKDSSLLKTGFGKLWGWIINSHTNGTLSLVDGVEDGAKAVGTITQSVGAATPASHASSELVSTGAMVVATHPVSVLTGNAIVAGNVVVVGTRTYTFRATLSNNPTVADEVLVGASLTASLLNLKNAINAASGAGLRGYTYSIGTEANTQVVATASNATTVTVRGIVPGVSLNSVATTGTALRTVWADTTLGGGTGASDAGVTTGGATVTIGTTIYTIVDALSETYGAPAVAYQVLAGAAAANTLDNLKLAINATGTAGTEYSTGTLVHPTVVATTNSDTVQTIRGRVPGASLDATVTTDTLANFAFPDTTLGGGTGNSNPGIATDDATITIGTRVYTAVLELSESLGATAVADQILWVTNEATFLDNLKMAINANGFPGTQYSTGTVQHAQVIATTNANTTQLIEAREAGVAGNSIATTATLDNYAWGATTLASGTSAVVGKDIGGTITFAAGPGLYALPKPIEFDKGLYATVGGTADITLIVD